MKVLIFYATYGGGHLSAANAMKEAIERKHKDYDIEMCDCMKYLNKVINYLTVKSYEGLAKRMPKVWGAVYKSSRKGPAASFSNSINRLLANKLRKVNKRN